MDVRARFRFVPLTLRWEAIEVGLGPRPGLLAEPDARGFRQRLLGPRSRQDVGALATPPEIHGDHGELEGRSALQQEESEPVIPLQSEQAKQPFLNLPTDRIVFG